MEEYKVNYKNAKFSGQKIQVDGASYRNCEFRDCVIVVEKGDTDLGGCRFHNCKLMLRGNAYTVGKLITLFTGKSPLKVLDLHEPLFESPEAGEEKGSNHENPTSNPSA
jgi:hypothetical protein